MPLSLSTLICLMATSTRLSLVIDQVTLAQGLVIPSQSIGVASTSTGFQGVDGILGIGALCSPGLHLVRSQRLTHVNRTR
jgi:hypothetical protein